jgi:hypothetical protein
MVSLEVSVSKGFAARRLGPVFDREYYFNPDHRQQIDSRCHELVARELADLGACFTESNLGRASYITPNQVLVGGIQPNMILAMLLGAQFVPGMDRDADVTTECCKDIDPAALPRPEEFLRHPLIETFDEQLLAVQRDGRHEPIPPFFWDDSGRAAVHGSLTTAQKLWGDRVFVDLLAEPARCREMFRWITEANVRLVEHYAAISGTTISGIHVGECSACMVSEKAFEEFVLPEVARIGEALGTVRFHSCGRCDHLIGRCLGIPHLGSVDVGGENSMAKIRQALGADFPVSIAPPTEYLTNPRPDKLLAWTRRALDENQGGPLTMVCHIEAEYHLASLRLAVALVRERGA